MTQPTDSTYDYIFAGAGCAGLSLLYRILQNPQLQQKRILVIDQSSKTQNDRTWCYWEKEMGVFEPLVCHRWSQLSFLSSELTKEIKLENYEYKMIRGLDFYDFVRDYAQKFENVTFLKERASSVESYDSYALLTTNKGTYRADYIFNSTSLHYPPMDQGNSLLQHFVGWEVKTAAPFFNPQVGTLMDFRVSQQQGDTFMYVLPTSTTEALVEYTLFTKSVLEKEAYEQAIREYLSELGVGEYAITHRESGVIPMSLASFPTSRGERVVHLGTAGGQTKASSGYTFQFVQQHSQQIADRLAKGKNPVVRGSLLSKRFQLYDRTLLDVMLRDQMTGKEIFEILFDKLPPELIFSFLANESTLAQEIRLMSTVPIGKFLPAAFRQMRD